MQYDLAMYINILAEVNLVFNTLKWFLSMLCLQEVKCEEDETLQSMISTAVNKLHHAINPVKL